MLTFKDYIDLFFDVSCLLFYIVCIVDLFIKLKIKKNK